MTKKRKLSKANKSERWKKVGYTAGSIVLVLVVIFLIKLNFGSYLDQVFDAMKSVLIPAALALFVAYLVRPLNNLLIKKGMKKNGAALLTILVFFIVALLFMGLIVMLVVFQFSDVIDRIDSGWPVILSNLEKIQKFIPAETLIQITDSAGEIQLDLIFDYGTDFLTSGDYFSSVFSATLNGLAVAAYWLIMVIMMPVFLFFFLKEGSVIMNGMINIVPKKWHRDDIDMMGKIANTSTERYIRGKLISIFFLFLFFSISFAITLIIFGQLPIMIAILYGVLFGGIIATLDLIPYIGPAIGILLPIFFILLSSVDMPQFLIFSAILIFIDLAGQNLQKIIIEPTIMSKEVNIHPLAVFTGLLFFGALFGFVGFVVATPIVATIRSIYNYLMDKYSDEFLEDLIDEDLNKDGVIAEVDAKV